MFKQIRFKMMPIILAGLLVIFFIGTAQAAKKKTDRGDKPAQMTEAELQAQVMAFADRFVAIIPPGIGAYQEQAPPPENYKSVFSFDGLRFYHSGRIQSCGRTTGHGCNDYTGPNRF